MAAETSCDITLIDKSYNGYVTVTTFEQRTNNPLQPRNCKMTNISPKFLAKLLMAFQYSFLTIEKIIFLDVLP